MVRNPIDSFSILTKEILNWKGDFGVGLIW